MAQTQSRILGLANQKVCQNIFVTVMLNKCFDVRNGMLRTAFPWDLLSALGGIAHQGHPVANLLGCQQFCLHPMQWPALLPGLGHEGHHITGPQHITLPPRPWMSQSGLANGSIPIFVAAALMIRDIEALQSYRTVMRMHWFPFSRATLCLQRRSSLPDFKFYHRGVSSLCSIAE